MAIIKANNLIKTYPDPDSNGKKFNAVDGVSLSIHTGEIFGILGPNGAGKTTTLEMLEGLKDIDAGSASINSIDISKNPYKVKEFIGVQLQANEYFDNMTLTELLNLFSALYNKKNDSLSLLKKVNLSDKANSCANELSGGQKQRFSIACALVNDPLVLFLDEPTTGLDPVNSDMINELILRIIEKKKMTAITITHDIQSALKIGHNYHFLSQGIVEDSGTCKNLLQTKNKPLSKFLLGVKKLQKNK